MTFPTVQGTATSSTNTAGTSHTFTLPSSIAAGELLLLLVNIGSTAATFNALAGWTELLDENSVGGLKVIYKIAAGADSNPTFTSSASTRSAGIAFRISGHNSGTNAPEVGTTATATSTNPDPPNLSVSGGATKDYLWIAFCGSSGEQADDGTYCTAFPTNYSSNQLQKACGTVGTNLGGMIACATRNLNGTSDNPGTFTVSENDVWRAQTVVVHPSVFAGAGPIVGRGSIVVGDNSLKKGRLLA